MPNAVWTGTISFGLVAVPVRLIPATEPKDVRFHLYDRAGRRVRYERVVEAPEPALEDAWLDVPATPAEPTEAAERLEPTGTATDAETETARSSGPLAWEDLVRGRETETGDVVLVTPQELEAVRPQRSRSIDVEDFVELADIDPVYFEKTYYAVPQTREAAKPYVLLHRAMREAGRIGIGRFVLRTKPHLVAVRPMREMLAVETLFFGDEVRDPAAFVPGLDAEKVDERELDLALRLIEMLETQWHPDAYADTYREELLKMLAAKAPTRPADEAPEPTGAEPRPAAVEQLMAALRESVEAAKTKRKAEQAKPTKRTKAG